MSWIWLAYILPAAVVDAVLRSFGSSWLKGFAFAVVFYLGAKYGEKERT